MSNEELIERIVDMLGDMDVDDRETAVLSIIDSLTKEMDVPDIRILKAEILKELAGFSHIPIVKATLDTIDGQLALREIGKEDGWR